VLDRIEAGQVAEPAVLAQRLRATFARYCDELYQKDLRSKIRDLTVPKNDVRRAVQLVWRLGIASADQDVVGLLARKDLTPVEKSRLYALLAALGTQPCVEALLGAAATKDQEAARALWRAEAKALEFLLKELPDGAGAMSDRAIAAYTATVHIARAGTAKPDAFWKSAKPEEQAKELERVRTRAEPVLQYWKERQSAGG
jgi:hypothetical protein